MKKPTSYKPKKFNLSGLQGISDKTLEMHFKLYEGYVKSVNELNEKIADILKEGKVDHEELPAYSELNRRLGFEYNGMVLHEYYFQNLQRGGAGIPASDSHFTRAAVNGFGSFETWKARLCRGRKNARRRLGNLLSGPEHRQDLEPLGHLA